MKFFTTTAQLHTESRFDRTERKMWQTEYRAGRITEEEWWTYRQYYGLHNPRQY